MRSASAELFDARLAAGSPLTASRASFAFANGGGIGDYRARVSTSADQPFFLVQVFGVCQSVTADERDRLRQVGPDPLELTA